MITMARKITQNELGSLKFHGGPQIRGSARVEELQEEQAWIRQRTTTRRSGIYVHHLMTSNHASLSLL